MNNNNNKHKKITIFNKISNKNQFLMKIIKKKMF